jgi:hypothetical protein
MDTMTAYTDFTADEQQLLRASLEAAGVAVSTASMGRKEETASEGFAAAQLILASRAAYVDNVLVSGVILALEERARSQQRFPDYVAVASGPGAREWAMDTLKAVVALLDAKAAPQDAAGYKRWLMDIASKVSQAGKEDQGFLGRGGVLVNDAERAALEKIAAVLGVAAP